ncbi:MAG TPA: tetratricopeptide repeat protein [Methylomirabilota bacterium]|nr:tetratricopeptide repeat protein [Methylomirabilota bacterium]
MAFLPSLRNGFVLWDDNVNLTGNLSFRGLGWTQLKWMFTGYGTSFYMPLTWLTYGLDYTLWGMNPTGYHLTSLIFHALNAGLFYFVSLRLLKRVTGAQAGPDMACRLGAAFAALLFSLHPLRVESVAWATERRDVVSGFFYLLAVLAYLRWCDPPPLKARSPGWYWGAVAAGAGAMLSKPMAVSLPLILVLLDVYPLRRLSASPVSWITPVGRRVWLEKLPFILMSAATSALTLVSFFDLNDLTTLPEVGWAGRVAVSFYALAAYLGKTIAPWDLTPVIEIPEPLDPLARPFLLSAAIVSGITLSATALRRRWPALLAAWICYIAVLLPVLGIFQFHRLMAADRYTYLACMGFALLAGGVVPWLVAARARGLLGPAPASALGLVFLLVLVGWGAGTWRQTKVWRDTQTLFRWALAVDPSCAICNLNLAAGIFFESARDQAHLGEAERHLRQAIALRPRFSTPYYGLGLTLAAQGRHAEAEVAYREFMRLDPRSAGGPAALGLLYLDQGRYDEALPLLRRAVATAPVGSGLPSRIKLALSERAEALVRAGRSEEGTRLAGEATALRAQPR